MSNHYYDHGAVHNDQHQEMNINGNLTTQQVVTIAEYFFADKADKATSAEKVEDTNTSKEAKEASGKLVANQKEASKEIFRFVHPALEEEEEWRVHREVERLVKRFDVQEICMRLNQLKKEGKVLLPQNTKNAHEELKRMGMPAEKAGFEYKTFCKYYNKD